MVNFWKILVNFENKYFWFVWWQNFKKMLECKFAQNWLNLFCFWLILLRFLFFRWQNFEKWYIFDKIVVFVFQNVVASCQILCDEHQTFCDRLLAQTIVTHSQTSPPERSHSSDMISWKNRIQIRLIDLQNVEMKSGPTISWSFHGRHASLLLC